MYQEQPNIARKKMELEEVKRRLHDIFVYYAQFGDRLNTVNLKSQTYHRLLKDAGIVEDTSGEANYADDDNGIQ